MGFKFKDSKHESEYKKAHSEVRKLRLQVMENHDNNFVVIDAALDAQLSEALNIALAKMLKLQPKHKPSHDIYLHAYA